MAMDGGDYYPDPTVGDRPEDVDKIVPLPLPHQAWAVSPPLLRYEPPSNIQLGKLGYSTADLHIRLHNTAVQSRLH